jgi:GNAT superfamily N-acetyltransferase
MFDLFCTTGPDLMVTRPFGADLVAADLIGAQARSAHPADAGTTDARTTDAGTTGPVLEDLSPRLRIGRLAAGDTATIREVFEGLSARSRQLRFHAGRSTLSVRTQHRLADIRPGAHVAHVAKLSNRPIGIARWIRLTDDPRSAELAVEVIDVAQQHGVGGALVSAAAQSARAAGVECLHAYISADNVRLRAWGLAHGAVADRNEPDLFRLRVVDVLAYLGSLRPESGVGGCGSR